MPLNLPPPHQREPRPHKRGRWQFTIGTMLMFTTLIAVLMGLYTGMVRAREGYQFTVPRSFIVLTIAAPMGLMLIIALVDGLRKWFGRRR